MRICFLVNRTERQTATYTTAHLALEAARAGHEVHYLDIDGFSLHEGGRVFGWTLPVRCESRTETTEEFAPRVAAAGRGPYEHTDLTTFDVVFLRNNPADHQVGPDAVTGNPALDFGRFLTRAGVLVLNDPDGMARAGTKMYLNGFPREIRARTLISKQPLDIKRFLEELDGPAVLKPLSGYGGENVFYLERRHIANRNQIIAAVTRGGYAIVQEYLPEAKRGDRRLLMLGGKPLFVDGKPAIYRRARARDDFRSNLHVGGTGRRAEFTEEDARTCAALEERFVADGLYFVGVDLVGSRLLELNVYAPGGIHNVNRFQGINVGAHVVRDLEQRVAARRR